jgi:tetratricopeptide (TPR) repeat protein
MKPALHKHVVVLAGAAAALLLCAAPIALAAGSPGGMSSGSGMGSGMSESRRIDPAAAYQSGMAALTARNYRQAISDFRDVTSVTPNDAMANYYLGVAYIGNQNARNARRPLERAIRSNDAPPDAWVQLGLVYLQSNDRAKAEEQLAALAQKVSACDAACGDTRRAQLQAAHDQLQQALNQGAQPAAPTTGWLPPGEGDGRAAFAAAVGLINGQHYEEALAQLAHAREAIGPHPDIFNYMGFANRKLHRYDAAMAYYNQALEINPRHLGATEYLGELYIEMGRMDDARRQLARLGQLCTYGCAEHEELQRWIVTASR